MARVRLSRKVLRTFIALGVIVLIGIALYGLSQLWLSYLWYQSVGQEHVFIGRIVSQLVTFLACSVVAFVIICGTMRLVCRFMDVEKRPLRIGTWGSVALAVISGLSMSSSWMTFRLAVAGSSFGIVEPLFSRDVGFFVFTLPAIEKLYSWIIGLLVLATILILAVTLIPWISKDRDLRKGGQWDLKTAASILIAFFMLLGGAGGFYLTLDHLELPSSGLIAGASYTDVHVNVLVYYILIAASIILAAILLFTARSKKFKLPVIAFSTWLALVILGTGVVPSLVQNYIVKPNEATLEKPYISYAIDYTLKAYGLDDVQTTEYPAEAEIPADEKDLARQQLSDVCLWNQKTATPAFNQLQQIRSYYNLSDLMTDRYPNEEGEAQKQVLISSRLIDTSKLPNSAQSWVNTHLVYTHGYGSAISSVSDAKQGVLQFALGGIPPEVSKEETTVPTDLSRAEQRLYFGPGLTSYIITNTGIDEFDYPKSGDKTATYRAKDITGVTFGGFLQRIAWTFKYGSTNFLFSKYPHQDSVVVDKRDIVTRANAIAPWFTYGGSPTSAIVDGRTYWILDGYTSSTRFPYSQPLADGPDKGKNYVRASVKVVVDAETGSTKFYAVGDDPIRDAWAKIFPSVITPQDEIPEALAQHFLYPRRAYDDQMRIYITYHMTDPMEFYDKEDQWQVSKTSDGSSLPSTYLMLSMPDEPDSLRLHLMKTFSPSNAPNLVSIVTAGCDPNNYGQLTTYRLPKGKAILSSAQVSAEINQDPEIAPQLALWSQSGSNVIMGDMLILPTADSIVYIQPVFLQAQKNAVTQLARVIVVNGNKTAMGLDLEDAFKKLEAK